MTTAPYEIRSDLKMPPYLMGNGRPTIYPLADMEVGQCIEVPASKRTSIQSVAANKGRKLGRTFRLQTISEENVIRVWRVR